jgi:uracil-DNA glycosylase
MAIRAGMMPSVLHGTGTPRSDADPGDRSPDCVRQPAPSHPTTRPMQPIPKAWRTLLRGETEQPYFAELERFLERERREHEVFPPEEDVFAALALTPPKAVRVVLLGQDPYHGPGQAHGLAFSVRPGVRPPPSLVNVFKELRTEQGCDIPKHGYLASWAEQGVLLLNAVLTVRRGQPNSHRNRGWERFTDGVLRAVNGLDRRIVFLLWGAYAHRKAELIDPRHLVLRAAHPSPFSAARGFFGSRPFSQTNRALEADGESPIDWCLPELPA